MNNDKIKIPVKLVLSGSGARGAYQYGFIKELMKSDKYEIVKIFGSSMGSLNSLLLSKNNFEDFWENYHELVPTPIVKSSIPFLNDILPLTVKSAIDHSVSQLYSFYSGNVVNDKKWNNFINNQVSLLQTTEHIIPFSLSQKTSYKTEIFDFDDNTKQNVPTTFLNKYLKDIITESNIYEQYDKTYWNINGNKNEYAPVKNIINDAGDSDNCIYIVLSLQSEENIFDCFPNGHTFNNDDFEKDMDYISYLYKYHIGCGQNVQNFYQKRYFHLDNNLMFLYHIEHQLLDNNNCSLPEYIQNCTENGKYCFEKFDQVITDDYDQIFCENDGQNGNKDNDKYEDNIFE